VIDMARYLVGEFSSVNALMSTWIPERPLQSGGADQLGTVSGGEGPRGAVDVDDEVLTMIKFANGAIGSIEATRNAHGRNNFLTFEIHGTEGSILFNYERRDELQVAFAGDQADRRGFRTVYTGPATPYGEGLWPIPALGIGYGETKIIEAHDFFKAIAEGGSVSPNFADGYQTALIDDAIIDSAETGTWVDVARIDS
jgi:predicted dehydrogenase